MHFKWCESQSKQHALAEIDIKTWKKPTTRFCDGLGFDWLGKERLSIEGSSGQQEENIDHTISDTAKQVSSTISMLKGFSQVNESRTKTVFLFLIQSIVSSKSFFCNWSNI